MRKIIFVISAVAPVFTGLQFIISAFINSPLPLIYKMPCHKTVTRHLTFSRCFRYTSCSEIFRFSLHHKASGLHD